MNRLGCAPSSPSQMPLHDGFITPPASGNREKSNPARPRVRLATAAGMVLFGVAVATASGALMFAMLYGASLAIR